MYTEPSLAFFCIPLTMLFVQVTGKKGMVIKGKVNRSSFEDIFKEKNILDQNPDVRTFLKNMVGDKDGY